jgi:hypothetical protein
MGRLVRRLKQCCLYRHISFSAQRRSLCFVSRLSPEFSVCESYFGRHSRVDWHVEMSIHNKMFERRLRMGLFPIVQDQKFRFDDVDRFLMQIHSVEIAECLESFAKFANRIISLIRTDEKSTTWRLSSDILVHDIHWRLFSSHVMGLVRLIRSYYDGKRDERCNNSAGNERLCAAVSLVTELCSRFSREEKQNRFSAI